MAELHEISNKAFRLRVEAGRITLSDPSSGFCWSDAPYLYRAARPHPEGTLVHEGLRSSAVSRRGDSIVWSGLLAGLRVRHEFELHPDLPIMSERITLENASDSAVTLTDLELGFERRLTDAVGRPLAEVGLDRFVAVPFRIRPSDPPGHVNDFDVRDFVTRVGGEMRQNDDFAHGMLPSRHRCSEGWLWGRAGRALGLFKLNQEGIEFSVLSTFLREDGLWLRFGGACMLSGEPSAWCAIAPHQELRLGEMRYHCLSTAPGGTGMPPFERAARAFRGMLDEKGCRFPRGYDPPVHWNELYDNPEWSLTTPADPAGARVGREKTRELTYTRELIEEEAVKAREYGCEALYLDPGWDTAFGSFLWDEARLGSLGRFVSEMRDRHGLAVSLHCPLATWMSHALFRIDEAGPASWPRESWRKDRQGRLMEGSVCLGSRAYLDAAVDRLRALCTEGVAFLMFDGTRWNGGCWNPEHGHPVPYRVEDHVRANLELAQRVHERYPRVLIEMHDMVSGGTRDRRVPVYYKYGLPGSYDENWGFELMWSPFQDLREGRARALYYYNLGCNVPVYLHVDLRDDNEHCLVLWWYASTCRHLGIGGTHASPSVASDQKQAMARYRRLDRFFKRGEFVGVNEEIHLHVLPEENAFVVNIFNLSDERRRISGSIPVGDIGVAADRFYARSERWAGFERDTLTVGVELPPWGAQVVECRAV